MTKNLFKKSFFFLLLGTIFFLLSSCEDCTFTSKNSTLIKVRFYPEAERINRRFRKASFTIDSVRTERGTVFRRRGANIDTLSLPINPTDRDNAYYVFFRRLNVTSTEQIIDTLQVSYNRQFSVISPNCGYDQKIDNLQIMPNKTTLKTATVFKDNLSVTDTLNIRIFF